MLTLLDSAPLHCCHINEETDAFFSSKSYLLLGWPQQHAAELKAKSVSVSANFVPVLRLCLALQVERDIDAPKSIP